MAITRAIQKYGKENFKIECLWECNTQDELDKQEICFVNKLNTWAKNGYNLRAGKGTGVMSQETKDKLSKANKGKKASLETRRKLSESHKGQIIPDYEIARRREYMIGKQPNALARQNCIKSCSKTYYFVTPDGRPIIIINMAKFCRENKISKSKMCEVATGKRVSCKGYKLQVRSELFENKRVAT